MAKKTMFQVLTEIPKDVPAGGLHPLTKNIIKQLESTKPTFPISTSDMRFADLPVTNNQNLSALQSRNKCFSSYFG